MPLAYPESPDVYASAEVHKALREQQQALEKQQQEERRWRKRQEDKRRFTQAQRAWFDEELTSHRPGDEKKGMIISRDADFSDFQTRWAKEQEHARNAADTIAWRAKKEKQAREEYDEKMAGKDAEYWNRRSAEQEAMRAHERSRRKDEAAEAQSQWTRARREQEQAAQQQNHDAASREIMRRRRGESEWQQLTASRIQADRKRHSTRTFLDSRTDDIFERDQTTRAALRAAREAKHKRRLAEGKGRIRELAEERAAAERAEHQKKVCGINIYACKHACNHPLKWSPHPPTTHHTHPPPYHRLAPTCHLPGTYLAHTPPHK